ncbi:hypothetical protein Acsp05_07790 [Actinokineospora sp. NBRC 105648]|nr:hypothetical protein Acsp05_07790 [Actinokineospora sp. NBRC 105648]
MVALAILSLVTSLVVSNMNYGARGRAMEANYKMIQQISAELESFFTGQGTDSWSKYHDIHRRYLNAVDSSENHSESDHFRNTQDSLSFKHRRKVRFDTSVTFFPVFTLAVPILVIIPFILWFIRGL